MKLYQKIATYGIVLAGLAGLYGCKNQTEKSLPEQPISKLEYFVGHNSIGNVGTEWTTKQGVSLAVGDMDGDGDLDVIAATAIPGEILYFENLGNGRYEKRGSIGNVGTEWTTKQGVSLAVGDMDGDGDLDVIAATAIPGEILYFENLGNGRYEKRGSIGNVGTEWTTKQGVSLAVGDMDGDGDLDVIAATAIPGEILFFENKIPQKK